MIYDKDCKNLSASNIYDAEFYSINERAYLAARSGWMAGDTLQTSVYDGIEPQIVKASDTLMMMYLDDGGAEDGYNFQQLVYSVWNGDFWNEPMPVDGNGLVDADFKLYSDGTDIWAVYTEANRLYTEADGTSDFVGAMEIVTVRYDGSGFTDRTILTDDNMYDMQPTICVANDMPTVVWVRNTSNDLFGMTSENIVYISSFSGGEWSAPEILEPNGSPVTSLAAGVLNDVVTVAVIRDVDRDLATENDRMVTLCRASGESHMYEMGVNGNVCFADNGVIWYSDGALVKVSELDGTPTVFAESAGADYKITDGTILFTVANTEGENGGSDIYASVGGGTPIRLTDTEGYVDSFDAAYFGGRLITVFRRTDVTFNEEAFSTVSDLCCKLSDIGMCNLTLDSVDYDYDDLMAGGAVAVTLGVTNNGFTDINSINVTVGDFSENVSVLLKSGESDEITINYTLPADLTVNPTLTATPDSTDINTADNSRILIIGYADFDVKSEQKIINNKNYLAVTVINSGNIFGRGVLSVTNEAEQTITLSAGEAFYPMYEKRTGKADVAVTSETSEYNTFNNEATTVIVTIGVIRGDANGDYTVNVLDLIKMRLHVSGKTPLTGYALTAADLDDNGDVDNGDIVLCAAVLLK